MCPLYGPTIIFTGLLEYFWNFPPLPLVAPPLPPLAPPRPPAHNKKNQNSTNKQKGKRTMPKAKEK